MTNDRKTTPEHVTSLAEYEVFVFGSNKEGQHWGGAAKFAYDNFGAEWGVGIGMTGQSYAIPTMDGDLEIIHRGGRAEHQQFHLHDPAGQRLRHHRGAHRRGGADHDLFALSGSDRSRPRSSRY